MAMVVEMEICLVTKYIFKNKNLTIITAEAMQLLHTQETQQQIQYMRRHTLKTQTLTRLG